VGLALGCVTLHTLVIASWSMWWGGHAYGPRLMTDVVPWLALLGIAGLRAMLDAPSPRPRARRREIVAGAPLVAASLAANAPGALVRATFLWNAEPDVDRHSERLWDWRRPQMLAGLIRPSTSAPRSNPDGGARR
jgi:hypothetical protein